MHKERNVASQTPRSNKTSNTKVADSPPVDIASSIVKKQTLIATTMQDKATKVVKKQTNTDEIAQTILKTSEIKSIRTGDKYINMNTTLKMVESRVLIYLISCATFYCIESELSFVFLKSFLVCNIQYTYINIHSRTVKNI